MARKGDIETDLTLEVDGKNITPEKFLRSVRSFFAILNEVTKVVADGGPGVEWVVQVKSGSNLVGVAPQRGFDPAIVARVTDAVSAGISQIENASARPAHFNERALRNLRDLGKVVGKSDHDDTKVRVWVRKAPIAVTHSSVANVTSLLASEHEDYGSIEGRLQTISERGRLQVVVYEPLWDESIRCFISDEMMSGAVTSFGHRVEIYGLIKYRKDGKPVSIDVEEIIPFPGSENIPSFMDVHGILRQAS